MANRKPNLPVFWADTCLVANFQVATVCTGYVTQQGEEYWEQKKRKHSFDASFERFTAHAALIVLQLRPCQLIDLVDHFYQPAFFLWELFTVQPMETVSAPVLFTDIEMPTGHRMCGGGFVMLFPGLAAETGVGNAQFSTLTFAALLAFASAAHSLLIEMVFLELRHWPAEASLQCRHSSSSSTSSRAFCCRTTSLIIKNVWR